jgi:formate hydrogenlyase subunit 3/multisubunit Na+/H+ antiporter MnhD subunit
MDEGTRHPDWTGRSIGLAVFTLGVVLLLVVFVWTNQLGRLIPQPGQNVEWDKLGIHFAVQIARLFVSGLIASWVAGRGAQLYAAANRALASD